MRVLFFSDVHCEIRESQTRSGWTRPNLIYPLDLGPKLEESLVGTLDLCILAGDIATVRPRRRVDTLGYASQVQQYLMCPVVVVPGNHEYYGGAFVEDRDTLLAATVPGVTVLDRGEAFYPLPDGRKLRVLGATLWTDYKVIGNQTLALLDAFANINDHRTIRYSENGRRAFAPHDALEEHEKSRAWLLEKLSEAHDGPTIIATHHVPHHRAGHPKFPMNRLTPAFCSDCDDVIVAAVDAGVVAWVCGHDHWSDEVEVGGLRIRKAQFGYAREDSNWTGPGLIED